MPFGRGTCQPACRPEKHRHVPLRASVCRKVLACAQRRGCLPVAVQVVSPPHLGLRELNAEPLAMLGMPLLCLLSCCLTKQTSPLSPLRTSNPHLLARFCSLRRPFSRLSSASAGRTRLGGGHPSPCPHPATLVLLFPPSTLPYSAHPAGCAAPPTPVRPHMQCSPPPIASPSFM